MSASTPSISVVVPVYNSERILPELVSRVNEVFRATSLSYEIILCDDGSTDSSWQVIRKFCKEDRRIAGLRMGKNRGQWCSTLAGMSKASGEYIVTIDDDLEYHPADILKLYERIISGGYEVVFGIAKDKYQKQGKSKRFAELRNILLNRFWQKRLTDSFRIFTRRLVFKDNAFLLTQPFEVFISSNLDYALWGYCAVPYNKRFSGDSNHSVLKKWDLIILYSSYYLAWPVKTFLLIAVASLTAALLFDPVLVRPHPESFFSVFIRLTAFLTGLLLVTLLARFFLQTKKFQPGFIAEQLNTANTQPERSPVSVQ